MGIVECKKEKSVCVDEGLGDRERGRPCCSPCRACLLVLEPRVEDPGKFSSGYACVMCVRACVHACVRARVCVCVCVCVCAYMPKPAYYCQCNSLIGHYFRKAKESCNKKHTHTSLYARVFYCHTNHSHTERKRLTSHGRDSNYNPTRLLQL